MATGSRFAASVGKPKSRDRIGQGQTRMRQRGYPKCDTNAAYQLTRAVSVMLRSSP